MKVKDIELRLYRVKSWITTSAKIRFNIKILVLKLGLTLRLRFRSTLLQLG